MNKFIYAACIGSLALTSSVWAAKDDDARWKGRAARANATNTQAVKSNRAQVNAQRNAGARHLQQQSIKTHNTATVRSNRVRHNDQVNVTSHQRNVDNTRLRNRSARKLEATTTNNNNVVVNRDRNVRVNREVNRNRNVRVTNNWRDSRFNGSHYTVFRNYHRQYHNRNWWTSHYNRIVFVGGGWYFWNAGYWFPAWGYDPGYYYPYDGPIYGYNSLAPDQVILNVQAQLQRDGYYDGPVDGLLGPNTRQAIADFQADHGLAITSAVDQPTLATLGLV